MIEQNEHKPRSYDWLILPLLIIAANAAYALINYDALPEKIPVHWNAHGNIDRWVVKTPLSVLQMPFVQLFITGVMVFSIWMLDYAGSKIPSPKRMMTPEAKKEIRLFIIASTLLLLLLFTFLNLNMLGALTSTVTEFFIVIGSSVALLGAGAIYITVRAARLSIARGWAKADDPQEASNWKMGVFYYNPQDPAFWVEKRFGLGYTINFAHGKKVLLFFAAILGVTALVVLGILLTSHTIE